MRAKSIFILEGVEGIGSILQDEVRVPVEALRTIHRLAHVAAVRLSIIHKAVVWALELHHTKTVNELRLQMHSVRIINTAWCSIYRHGRNALCSLKDTGIQSRSLHSNMYRRFCMDWGYTLQLWRKTGQLKPNHHTSSTQGCCDGSGLCGW